jgi:uncharacterized protein (TIGR02596 family)
MPTSRPRAAFTLAEMLIVIAIIMLLVALITPALIGIVDNANLKVAATTMSDTLNLARQTAITSNRAVEVRFYKVPKENAAPDAPAGERFFRAIAMFRIDDAGPKRLGGLVLLKGNVRCADDSRFGTLLNDAPKEESTLYEVSGNATTKYEYRYILFRADGTTTLPPSGASGDTWHTLIHNGNKTPVQAVDSNYATIQLDPATGRTRTLFPGT